MIESSSSQVTTSSWSSPAPSKTSTFKWKTSKDSSFVISASCPEFVKFFNFEVDWVWFWLELPSNFALASSGQLQQSVWTGLPQGVTALFNQCSERNLNRRDLHTCSGTALQVRRRVDLWRAGRRCGYSLFMWSTMFTSDCRRSVWRGELLDSQLLLSNEQ